MKKQKRNTTIGRKPSITSSVNVDLELLINYAALLNTSLKVFMNTYQKHPLMKKQSRFLKIFISRRKMKYSHDFSQHPEDKILLKRQMNLFKIFKNSVRNAIYKQYLQKNIARNSSETHSLMDLNLLLYANDSWSIIHYH